MKTGQAGLNLIKKFEGCRMKAYKCPAGVWTIGYGHTSGVTAGQTITQAEADNMLVLDVEKFEQKVNKYNDRYRWNQNEFDAMVSFAFNLGSIDKLTANGTRSRAVIAEKMLLYNKAAGKVLVGLTRRRQAELDLFLKPVDCGVPDASAEYYTVPTIRTTSIVMALNNIKVDSTMATRKKIAAANGIEGYEGSYDQNVQMLKLLKAGKLKKELY